jgi:ClpP class serine protease
MANSIQSGTFNPQIIEQAVVSTRGELYLVTDEDDPDRNPFDQWQEGSIAIIPLSGTMMKRSYWWGYGVDEVAGIIRQAYLSDRISAVIIKGDTPGGVTNSLFLLEEVLSSKLKPTYGYVDGQVLSCGYIAFSFLDKIYAINKMAAVGGIGVFARIVAPNKENSSYNIIDVYPKESKDKNLDVREAIDGKTGLMEEELSKMALQIQATVKANRPDIGDETLTGKEYYAYEAEQLGMIDGIRTLRQVVEELQKLTETRKQILLTFNS